MKDLLLQYLSENYSADHTPKIQITPVPKGKKGDLALNFFALTKELGQSPIDIAKSVQDSLSDCELITDSVIDGPYLNVTCNSRSLFQHVLDTPTYIDDLDGQTIIIEFSGPNTNKPLHLGHMRNHALGISVGNLVEACGADVKRVNIINDRGVHICKSMLAYRLFGNGETPASAGVKSDHLVGDYYVQFDKASKEDPTLNDQIQEMLVAWENNDPEVRQLWDTMSAWALEGHAATYERQGIKFVKEYKESDYYLKGKNIAEEGLKKGVFKKREDGAIIIDLSDEGLDEKVILRADGTSIYLTQDLAVAEARFEDYKPNRMIYTVADEQNYHFKVLFICLEKLGILPKEKLYHLGYGLVNLPDGRMKSREGNVVDADNLMDDLSDIAFETIGERHPDMDPMVRGEIAEQIMNAAWKFYLLTTSPKKSITFDKEKSIAFEGASGPYVQYAGVRIRSLFRKAGGIPDGDFTEYYNDIDKTLGNKIMEYPDVLRKALHNYNPTYITTYLLELAQAWSSYYVAQSVLNADTQEEKNARLQLAAKVLEILEAGLSVLGIEIPDQM